VISRIVDNETVLLDLERGLYFGLDGVGKLIWEAIGRGRTLGEIAADIASEYDVDRKSAQADVIEFASGLVGRGLLSE
jgi:hypothetical protein